MPANEYAEDDVYICESKYFLEDKAIRKLRKGLKKFTNQPGTIEDEVYFFKQPIVPRKSVTPLLYEASQTPLDMDQLTASSAAAASSALSSGGGNGAGSLNFDDDNTRDSMSTSTTMDEVPTTPGTPQGGRNNRTGASSKKKKCPSGYVVYASEVRKRIMMENEGAGFGDISREVGQMWRKLPQSEKDVYERRAADTRAKMEAEKAAAAAAAAATAAASAPSRQSPPTQQQQYPIAQPPMMPHHQYQPAYQQQPMVPQQQQQQFMGQQPVYPQQMAYPPQQPQQGVTFYPVSGPAQQQMQYQQQHRPAGVNGFPPHQQQPMLSMQQPQQQQQPPPQLPVFVAAPPKTTRALHSEIYKRYIERLRSNSAYLSDWDRQATPAQLNCKPNASVTQQLHDSFLGAPAYQKQQQQQQQQQQAELTNALCSLRDHLLRDALKIELSLNQL
ncbi:hypothetical protein BOX15_Mlig024745g2 [Macrostomum lignano]|uniref:HMG box domain-containing protein n=1 Tax=Macrostomum lignano TaxID=282301 RepID=A0A267FTL3_9PLAT|nr:hypothetical protein BOX15_Mlig024745g2 [Macrostomum lignano]